MKYKNIVYIGITLLIAAFILYRFVGNPPQSNQGTTQTQKQNTVSTQTSSEGAVTIKVTPKTLTVGSEAIFEIVFDTHSVELNYDVAQIAKLTDDIGNTYKPISWTGRKGGHHVEGVLTFPSITDSVKKATLTIPGIDNKDRVFTWDLK
jgi:cytoskeletal protein RodZ